MLEYPVIRDPGRVQGDQCAIKTFFAEKFTFTRSAALDDDRFKKTNGKTKIFGQKLLFNLFGQNEKP